jgi:SAM-dependent methyltransferase
MVTRITLERGSSSFPDRPLASCEHEPTRTGGQVPGPQRYEPTTERLDVDSYLSSAGSYLIYLFHIQTYAFAAERLPASSRVLDFGCGSGYGSALRAGSGHAVDAVDVSGPAISYARERYPSPDLRFRLIAPVEEVPLPYEDGTFDAVVSFQVIEHVPSVDAYLAEVARVLRPGGAFICATPDRDTRLLPRQRPWNRWHLEEFTQRGLAAAVARHLDVDEVMGMTAPAGVVDLELRRARLLRAVTLPFTFPGAPERWRIAGLEGLRKASRRVGAVRSQVRRRAPASPGPTTYAFGPEDIVIAPGAEPSTNIVVTASGRRGPSGW